MSERTNKLVIVPSEIRGWGNVLKNKSSSNFTKHKCTISQSNSSHDGFTIPTFYIKGLITTIIQITDTLEDWYGTDDSFGVTIYLKTVRNATLANVIIKAYVDDVFYSSTTTNAQSRASFTFSNLTTGNKSLKFVYNGTTTLGASEVEVIVRIGVNIATSQSQDYYYPDETVSLVATITKYGLNTIYEGLVNFSIVDDSDSTNAYNFTNVQTNSSGVATVSRQISTPGHYSWTASVDSTTSTINHLYIVDLPYEFNEFLEWYHANTVESSGYEGTVDIRDNMNEYLDSLYTGSIAPTSDTAMIERIDAVIVGLHNYYNDE